MQNLTVQKLIIGLIVAGFFILAPWMTSEILDGNALPFLSLLGVGILLLFLFVLKDRCWMVIPFSLPIEGRLNFLPLNFSMQETAVMAVVAYIFIQIIMGRQISWRLGPKVIWVPLAGLLCILLYHWISSGDIGIRALGGSGWGARKYVSILLAVITMPILMSFSGASWKDFQKIPLIYFFGTFVDLIPELVSTAIPQASPYMFRVYSTVNLGAYGSTIVGNFEGGDSVVRFGTFRALGQAMVLVVISYFPFYVWLNPNRLWITPALILAFLATAFAGYRSAVFNYAALLFAGLYATGRSKVLLLLPLGVGVALMIAATQGSLFEYPRSVQRALCFLPGQWAATVSQEAENSSKWRDRIRELFFLEYFKKAPWLGTGYGFDPEIAKKTTELFLRIAALKENDEWADVRSYIDMKQPHEGDIHALVVSGALGAGFFILFCLASVVFALRSVLKYKPQDLSPVQIWSLALLVQQSFSFFAVFGDYVETLTVMCPVVIILAASEKLRPTGAWEADPTTSQPAPFIPSHLSPRPTAFRLQHQ